MELAVLDDNSKLSVSDKAFGREFNEALVHQAVTAYMAGGRAGTKAQKNRSAVAGGGAKPWRQKGTGRARAGTSRGPIWRTGGVTFAAKPRSYDQKMNKKMVRAAYASILSELVRQDRLKIVKDFSVSTPKTKDMLAKLKAMDVSSALIVTHQADVNLYLSVRNLPYVEATEVGGMDPVSLVKYEHVIMTADAAKQVEEWIG